MDQTILAVLSLLLGGGFVTSIIQALKARPERDSVVVLPWKDLNAALRGQNETLRLDYQRERDARLHCERERDALEHRIDMLAAQVRALGAIPVGPAGGTPPVGQGPS